MCRNCGQDLAPDETPHLRPDPERSFWRQACGCFRRVERPVYEFTDEEVVRFSALLADRGAPPDLAAVLGRPVLNGLAQYPTKTVLGLPDGDIVITAEEAREAIGRDLPRRSA